MATTNMEDLIQTYAKGPNKAKSSARFELEKFSLDDVRRVLNQLQPLANTKGSNCICGPVFNRHVGYPIWLHVTLWSIVSIGTVFMLPIQVCAGFVLVFRGRVRSMLKELPVPTYKLINWGKDMVSFIKAPLKLIKQSVERGAALCVNRQGSFSIKENDYAVMSHVWGETMGWQTPNGWGAVDISLRRMGIARAHFLRFFDRCESEWLWVDVIAMPEVLEDMSETQKEEMERLRVGVINCLHSIYTNAEKVVVIDSLLLRLSTRSPVDVAVVLCLSFWITRVWSFTESKLAKKVILKTSDSSFDLNKIIEFLGRTTLNDTHRYYGLRQRISILRDEILLSGCALGSIMENVYYGHMNKFTDVEVDRARALFPLFNLKWEYGWTLQQGVLMIVEACPNDAEWVQKWRDYHEIELEV